MALQQIRIGSAVNVFQYDDAAFDSGIDCTAPISAASPVNPGEVLTLGDYPGLAISTINDIVMFENEVVGFNNNVVIV